MARFSDKNIKPVLVVGASGMLGRPVVRRLVQDGIPVRAFVRSTAKARRMLPSKVEFLFGDLQSVEALDQAMSGCGAVYVTVDTMPGTKFRPETEGLRNVITAAKNHPGIRLLVLSAFGNSNPAAENHPWWHIREKFEAQKIAKSSGLPWTILEPTWFMESIPLFVKGNSFSNIKGARFRPYWVAGHDFGGVISSCIGKDIGQEQIIPVQGPEKMTLLDAARRFIRVYNPAISIKSVPLWLLVGIGFFSKRAKDLVTLIEVSNELDEPAPNLSLLEPYGVPLMTIESYAGYVNGTGDFPQK